MAASDSSDQSSSAGVNRGVSDLSTLLRKMAPTLRDERYAFVAVGSDYSVDWQQLEPFATVREDEGLTVVLPVANAIEAGLPHPDVFRMISLSVHSDLAAVGLTAAVSQVLAARGISANVIAGYYHDHIFVPDRLAQAALDALVALSNSTQDATKGEPDDGA